MRHFYSALAICLLLLLGLAHAAYALETVVASKAILVAVGADAPLYSKNAAKQHPPASLTKVLTAVIAIESGRLDEKVTVSATAPLAGGSALYLKAGEVYTLSDLLYAALLVSANDAAAAIAEHLGGSIEGFSDIMNTRAAQLGMKNSHFNNPHGMPETGQFSTAEDLSILGRHAAKLPLFLSMAKTPRHTLEGGKTVVNQNKILGTNGVLAGKTGYTDEAGQCLLTIAERDGLTLVSVVLGSQGTNMWSDTTTLLQYGFNNYVRRVVIMDKQTISVMRLPLAGETLVVAKGELVQVTGKNEQLDITTEVRLAKRIWPPVKPGQEVGEIIIRNAGNEIARVALTVPVYIPLVTGTRLKGILFISMLLGATLLLRWRRKR